VVHILGRNKKCITLNLKDPRGQEIVRQLAGKVDVAIENFKPGTLEKWGLGDEDLKAINPKLIMARVSGYGQTGPYASRPGYANVAEGFSGCATSRASPIVRPRGPTFPWATRSPACTRRSAS
jgi:crotonobetainyl-CoA:carnitine CoA-transferase CaiB-like acyl-CoA transferase